MKKILKILSLLVLFPCVILTFLNGSISLIEGKNLFSPYIDTEFATDFKPEKMELVKINQTQKEVIKILGEPLRKEIDSINNKIMFLYSVDGKLLHKADKMNTNDYDDFAWLQCVIIFNDKNKVEKINTGWTYD